MKTAIISVTYKGALLADRLAELLNRPIDVYAKNGRNTAKADHLFEHLGPLVDKLFSEYNNLVFVMATGIVVRVIAPFIYDKRFDPAIVVMDDNGNYAISLLSGKIGAANELAIQVAEKVGARPIITTNNELATGLPQVDVVAVKLELHIEPLEKIKRINSAIVFGEKVIFFIDTALKQYKHYCDRAAELGVGLTNIKEVVHQERYNCAVIISDKVIDIDKPHVYLRPPTLAVGVGCKRGTSGRAILQAVTDACKSIGRSIQSVAVIGTIDIKSDEIGLLSIAQQLELPIEFYTVEQLNQCIGDNGLICSDFAEETVGVGNVCEAAAILAGQSNEVLLAKTVYQGITVAIAECSMPVL